MDYSTLTLGQLLSSQNETVRRGALGILKELQRITHPVYTGAPVCFDCGATFTSPEHRDHCAAGSER